MEQKILINSSTEQRIFKIRWLWYKIDIFDIIDIFI